MFQIIKQSTKTKVYLSLLLITFVFYGNTIPNEYALDDSIVITENQFTRQGLAGIDDILEHDSFTGFFGEQKELVSGGRYRPLSLVTFAIEYEFFGKNPHISHLVNVLLLFLTGMVLYIVFRKLFWHIDDRPWYLSISFLIALFFIAHPIHTEAVANIKGRDEILSFLFSIITLHEAIRFTFKKKIKYLVFSFVFFFLALMAKENAVTFLAVIPLTLYFFREKASVSGYKTILVPVLPSIIAFAVYLVIRNSVLGYFSTEPPGELMNNPFLYASSSEQYGTILYTLGLYLKLLVIPHPLTYDYYPYHISLVEMGEMKALIPLFIYILLIFIAIFKLRSKSIISYSIFYYLITLSIVSNLFFPVGTFMNERFLYMPSLGFNLFMAYLISHYLYEVFRPAHLRPVMIFVFIFGIMAFSGYKIINRNQHWKNNFTLFTHDVLISENSAKSNTSAGGIYMEHALETEDSVRKEHFFQKALFHLRRAVEIYPDYTDALLLLGNTYYHYQGDIDSTLYYYEKILKRNPNYNRVFENLRAMVMEDQVSTGKKIKICQKALKYAPDKYFFNYRLGKYYAQYKDDIKKGTVYLERAVKSRPESVEALKDLGVAYGIQRRFDRSIDVFDRAIELKPDDPQLYINQGINYRQRGDVAKASYYFQRARELQRKQG